MHVIAVLGARHEIEPGRERLLQLHRLRRDIEHDVGERVDRRVARDRDDIEPRTADAREQEQVAKAVALLDCALGEHLIKRRFDDR